MALKKDLAALAARESLIKKNTGKRKRPASATEEKDLQLLKRGSSTPKAAPSAPVEKVGEGLSNLSAQVCQGGVQSLLEGYSRKDQKGLAQQGHEVLRVG